MHRTLGSLLSTAARAASWVAVGVVLLVLAVAIVAAAVALVS